MYQSFKPLLILVAFLIAVFIAVLLLPVATSRAQARGGINIVKAGVRAEKRARRDCVKRAERQTLETRIGTVCDSALLSGCGYDLPRIDRANCMVSFWMRAPVAFPGKVIECVTRAPGMRVSLPKYRTSRVHWNCSDWKSDGGIL